MAQQQAKLTKRTVDAALIPKAGETWIWDTELKGFFLRIRPSGGKTHAVRYSLGSLQNVFTIGRHGSPWTPDEARTAAHAVTQADAASAVRDIAQGKTATDTRTGPRGRARVTGGEGTARRTRAAAAAAAMYAWGAEQGLVKTNPFAGVKMPAPPFALAAAFLDVTRLIARGAADRRATGGFALRRLTPLLACAAFLLTSGCAPRPTSASARLVETPATGAGDTLAVLYSGDGGWANIDRGVVDGLARGGVPSVGYDSQRYFWTRRTPQAAADDLAGVARRQMKVWGKSKLLLIGYSFGADALPMIVAHLPADIRAHVRMVVLLSVQSKGDLEFRPDAWLGIRPMRGFQVAPLLRTLRPIPSVCIYGEYDRGAACPAFAPGLITSVQLTGGHHFGGNYSALSRAILQAAGLSGV